MCIRDRLPLSIMDSALFYGSRMNRTQTEAVQDCDQVLANARRFGGTVVINWHDRSLAPERLWDGFYRNLLAEVEKGDRAWFSTAGGAVDWFRWRRSFRFTTGTSPRGVTGETSSPQFAGPPAVVGIHCP